LNIANIQTSPNKKVDNILFLFILLHCLLFWQNINVGSYYIAILSFAPKQSSNIEMFHLKELSKKFMNMDPEFAAVAFAFVIACMIWASPLFFLRDNVLGKIVMVAAIITLTMYHRIAGLIALIAIIAILNQTPMKEGMVNPLAYASGATPTSPAPAISFKTPDEFRQKYCVKGLPDDPTQSGKFIMKYMLSPAFFTKMDASGNPIIGKDQIDAFKTIDMNSFTKCTPMTLSNGGTQYETINNLCDHKCEWTIAAPTIAAPTTAPTGMPSTEGFTPMLRPHIRTGRLLVTNGLNNLKSGVNRLKRQLF
jgi:hypothetical protein